MSEEKNWWTCSECRYTMQAVTPPETCPSCHKKCEFIMSTCFNPDCGGQQNPDPQIVQGAGRG